MEEKEQKEEMIMGRNEKPLSEVFAGIQEDIAELEGFMYKKVNALKSKINYHVKKHKLEELRRRMRELRKR